MSEWPINLSFPLFYKVTFYGNTNMNQIENVNMLLLGIFTTDEDTFTILDDATASRYVSGATPIQSRIITKLQNLTHNDWIQRIKKVGISDYSLARARLVYLIKFGFISSTEETRNEWISRANKEEVFSFLAHMLSVSIRCPKEKVSQLPADIIGLFSLEPREIESAASLPIVSTSAYISAKKRISDFLHDNSFDSTSHESLSHLNNLVAENNDIDSFTKAVIDYSYKKQLNEYRNCILTAFKSIQYIDDDAAPDQVDNDWFSFYFDRVRLISDESMQNTWAKLLAEEMNTPGKYSRSLIHTLSIMSKSQAQDFCNVVRFCMFGYKSEIDDIFPFIFLSKNVESYKKSNIDEEKLSGLANLGLITFSPKDEYVFLNKKILRYGNRVIEIYGNANDKGKIYTGNVKLTDDGKSLVKLVGNEYKSYRSDILDFTIQILKTRNYRIIINKEEIK